MYARKRDHPSGWRARMKLHSDLTWEPPTDVVETEREIIIIVEVPGMDGRDIDVVTDGKIIKISGTRKNITPRERKQFHKLEIQVGPFERILELPVPVDQAEVSAQYNKGILNIKLQKLEEQKRVRRVEIE
jgi:HSP20 family protein